MPGLRKVKLWEAEVVTETRNDGTILVRQKEPLGEYPEKLGDRLVHWSEVAPERTFLAQRVDGGDWRRISFAETLASVRSLGQALLGFGLSPDRPLVILSGNDLDHALLGLAAQYIGVPYAPLSVPYSLASTDFKKLREIVAQITPGIVFAADGQKFANAINEALPGIPVIISRNPIAGRECHLFSDLLKTEATPAVDAAFAATTADTIGKFLFTSGSTGAPKPVIQTQRMMCSNQEMVADCYAFLREKPPVVVDWAPWNHTASGNKVFNMMLYNGGTYYIDEGKPTPALMGETIRNLKEISPSWYFNVPVGYEMLTAEMEKDHELRDTFYRNLNMQMYAGAGLAQHTWDALNRMSEESIGARVLLATGLGSTETGPFSLMCTEEQETTGNVGIPAKGCDLKLVPVGDRLEARLRGPHITPGYWRSPKLTEEAFDEEGYYRIGDALKFAVPGDASKGFFFDGRIAENFKLRTGTWVAVGPLRASLVNAFGGIARDAVITGENRTEIGALLLPDVTALRALLPAGERDIAEEDLYTHPVITSEVAKRKAEFNAKSTGSSNRIGPIAFLTVPLSMDKGEVTDKGSVNQRAVLRGHSDLVDALYEEA
jgi:feruloyl-CoA synthase